MASIRKRTRVDGTAAWTVLYRLDGRQTSATFSSEREAQGFKHSIDVAGPRRAMEIHGIPDTTRTAVTRDEHTVASWLRHHIEHLTGVETHTLDVYRRYTHAISTEALGAIPLSLLGEDDIARWVKLLETKLSKKTGRPLSPKTIKNMHGFLSGALAAAVKQGHLAANPAAGRRLPRGADDEVRDMRMLSRDEMGRLLDAVTEQWKPLVEFLLASGCRWGEATALKPSDVDRSVGTVKIRRAWKYSSKGYEIGAPKTKRSRRTINVPPHLLEKLNYSGEWVFTTREGDPVRYSNFYANVWLPAVKRAGLDPPPRIHDLRHTCASWMLNAGVPVPVVSRHLGHESIQVTVDIYGDVDRTVAAAAANIMGQLLQRTPAVTAGPLAIEP